MSRIWYIPEHVTCPDCDGDGIATVCPHWHGGCDCARVQVACAGCNGAKTIDLGGTFYGTREEMLLECEESGLDPATVRECAERMAS